jgi:hypothetical protein
MGSCGSPELWAHAKIDWLRGFMRLEHGIPSHDTIGCVFGMIAPDEFESAFRRWLAIRSWRSTARPAGARSIPLP